MIISAVINFETVITNCVVICWQPVNETFMKKSNPGGCKRMKWEKTTALLANVSRAMRPRPFNSFQGEQNVNNPRRRRVQLPAAASSSSQAERTGRTDGHQRSFSPGVIYDQLIFSLNTRVCVYMRARVCFWKD